MPTQRIIGKGATLEEATRDLELRLQDANAGALDGEKTYEVGLYQGNKKVGTGTGSDYATAQTQALEVAGITAEVVLSGTYRERVAVTASTSAPRSRAPSPGITYENEPTRYTTRM